MVWQDMPNLWDPDGEDSVAVRSRFRTEWKEIIDQLISVPSIVVWVPFNENWGAFEVTDITDWTKKYDPSRLVNGNSGYNLSCAIYTQTTDVEHEINGLVTYDRQVEKMDFQKVKAINEAVIKTSKELNNK